MAFKKFNSLVLFIFMLLFASKAKLRGVTMTSKLVACWFFLLSSCKADPKAEVEALLKWKKSLPADQPILKSWVAQFNSSRASSPCKWRGIACNNEGSVTEIKLNYTGLKGTLENLDFFSFPNLLHLDLRSNQPKGTIPMNIGTLSKLQFLDLSINFFNGSLPLSLANLTKVYELDVSQNNITGKLDSRLFPDGTGKSKTGLISLKNFLLQTNGLVDRIPEEIGNLKHLALLALDGNYFFGPIPSSLGNLSDLTILRLAQNQLLGQIPISFGTLKLTELFLLKNKLSGSVPEEIGNLSSLVTLHLAENNFTGHLPQQVGQGGKLTNFSAAFNNFTGPIPISLKNCRTLYRVRLEHNQLTGYIDQDFGVYPNLTYIDLSYNRLIVEIGKLSNLIKLILKDNKLSGEVLAGIGGLFELESLDLSINMLGGPIPNQIGDCWKLQSLSLRKNCLNETIPYQIGNLRALQDLDLSFNSLMGGIPPQLGSLSDLEYLNIPNNNLNGSVPSSLGSMLSLISVNLSNKNLEGPLPEGKIFRSATLGAFNNNKDLCGEIQGLRPCNAIVIKKGGGNKKSKILIVIVASIVGALSISFALVGIFVFIQKKHSRNMSKVESTSKIENPFSVWHFNGNAVYEDILEASNNFDDMYRIGMGASAKVYKVEIPGAQVLAVKKLNSQAEGIGTDNIKSFSNELATLTKIRHRNIVKLLGFCFHEVHMFLIYEFMERGSLANMLSRTEAMELDWATRVQVVKGVAYALSYMHHDCLPLIIHRDISSKNVLISSDLEACISNFGTARFLKPDSSNWTTIAGTYGYPALEVLIGKHPAKLITDLHSPVGTNIHLKDVLDDRLSSSTSQKIADELALMINLAVSCLHTNPQSRPTRGRARGGREGALATPSLTQKNY
ncbi:mdis1-interacting receptor like kinase 2 [Quercus suber]|uniref:non-specific serine/threonine protein kinase n=1 Tax=Quercus suber TaxID=58331 RepID=A0AAW0LFH6_QUESU